MISTCDILGSMPTFFQDGLHLMEGIERPFASPFSFSSTKRKCSPRHNTNMKRLDNSYIGRHNQRVRHSYTTDLLDAWQLILNTSRQRKRLWGKKLDDRGACRTVPNLLMGAYNAAPEKIWVIPKSSQTGVVFSRFRTRVSFASIAGPRLLATICSKKWFRIKASSLYVKTLASHIFTTSINAELAPHVRRANSYWARMSKRSASYKFATPNESQDTKVGIWKRICWLVGNEGTPNSTVVYKKGRLDVKPV